jgi:hypothetical protein
VATVGQLTLLAPVAALDDGAAPAAGAGGRPDDGPLCVVNTHLFFHPRAPHIRAMHTAALLAEATALVDDSAAAPALRGRRPALLFCGDLNSDINDGVPGAALGRSPQGYPGCPSCGRARVPCRAVLTMQTRLSLQTKQTSSACRPQLAGVSASAADYFAWLTSARPIPKHRCTPGESFLGHILNDVMEHEGMVLNCAAMSAMAADEHEPRRPGSRAPA